MRACSFTQVMRPCGLSRSTTATACPAQSAWRRSRSWSGSAGMSTQASRSTVFLAVMKAGPAALVLDDAQLADEAAAFARAPLHFGAPGDQRSERRPAPRLLREEDD